MDFKSRLPDRKLSVTVQTHERCGGFPVLPQDIYTFCIMADGTRYDPVKRYAVKDCNHHKIHLNCGSSSFRSQPVLAYYVRIFLFM